MAELRAGTKYEDWEGTASGDNAMKLSVEGWLRSKGLQSANEHLVAFALDSGENHGGSVPTIRMKTYLHAGSASFGNAKAYIDGEAGELTFKVVQTQIDAGELLGLFKLFNLVLTRRGLDLAGREVADND